MACFKFSLVREFMVRVKHDSDLIEYLTKLARKEILSIIEKPNLKQAEPYRNKGEFCAIAGLLVLNTKIFEFINMITIFV